MKSLRRKRTGSEADSKFRLQTRARFEMGGLSTKGLCFALAWFLCCETARATIELPLDGYYRPGRFFPVLLNGPDATGATQFSCDGCLIAQVDASNSTSRIAPILAVGAPRDLHWAGGSLALRQLQSNERLVASTTTELTADLFPGARLIAVQLDPAALLSHSPPAAWESLDALLLDSTSFQRITDGQRSALLAGGALLAARGDRPDARWPWRRQGSLWILSADPHGPGDELVDDRVYVPTYAWLPGWSARVRGQVMGIATLFLLMIGAILLIKHTLIAPVAAVVLSIATAAGIVCWRASLGSVDRTGGDIILAGHGLIQRDSWVYLRGRTASMQIVPWAGWTHPIFASANALHDAEMQMHVDANDQLTFDYQAAGGHTMAFVRREIQPGDAPSTTATRRSPMQEAAKAAYLAAGMKIAGETPGEKGRWPGVVISR